MSGFVLYNNQVKRRKQFYHFSDSMNVCKAFDGISRNWFIYVDAVRVEKVEEVLTIMAADHNGSKLELIEGKNEIGIGMHMKDLTPEEGLETKVAEKKTRKRKIVSSDGKKSRKKLMIDVNQSPVASGSYVVLPREQVDDIVTGAMGKGKLCFDCYVGIVIIIIRCYWKMAVRLPLVIIFDFL